MVLLVNPTSLYELTVRATVLTCSNSTPSGDRSILIPVALSARLVHESWVREKETGRAMRSEGAAGRADAPVKKRFRSTAAWGRPATFRRARVGTRTCPPRTPE